MTPDAGVGLPTATADADTAARAAGVEVRLASEIAELEDIQRLYTSIWRAGANPPVTSELLRALATSGNYVAGAFVGEEIVGACVGFFADPSAATLHSHIAGVSTARRLRNVGFALKLHQRAWAIDRGLDLVEWTYDPLVARNAHFNLVKLAAEPVRYLPNFYGAMSDAINGNDDSDRLLLHWRVSGPEVGAACSGTRRPGLTPAERERSVVALGTTPDGRPRAGRPGGDVVLVAVPADIEELRASRPSVARDWRLAVRETLVELLRGGSRVVGFDRAVGYVVDRRTG